MWRQMKVKTLFVNGVAGGSVLCKELIVIIVLLLLLMVISMMIEEEDDQFRVLSILLLLFWIHICIPIEMIATIIILCKPHHLHNIIAGVQIRTQSNHRQLCLTHSTIALCYVLLLLLMMFCSVIYFYLYLYFPNITTIIAISIPIYAD